MISVKKGLGLYTITEPIKTWFRWFLFYFIGPTYILPQLIQRLFKINQIIVTIVNTCITHINIRLQLWWQYKAFI